MTAPSASLSGGSIGATAAAVVRVFGSDDNLARSLRPSALNAPTQHRVAVLVRPEMRQRSWLAADLLAALGVSHTVSGIARDADTDWLLAHTWLVAREVTDLLVLRAEWLPEPLLEDLLLLAAGCGTRLWMLMTPPRSNGFVRTLDQWTTDELDWAAFLAVWRDVPGLLAGPAGDAMPDASGQLSLLAENAVPALLPDDDFPAFRAACRDTLPAGDFAAVDALLTAEQQLAAAWLAGTEGRLAPGMLADRLLERYDRCASTGELVVTTRAWQVAMFRHGWFLQVDLPRLVSTAEATPRRAQRSPALWQRLAVYRQPHRSAACLLAALGFDLAGMAQLPIADVSADGSAVRIDGAWRRTEAGTAVYLRAMLALRLLHGAEPHDPLLAAPDGSLPRERAYADAISAARSETGVAVTSRLVARKRVTAGRWYIRWGVSVQRLDGPR